MIPSFDLKSLTNPKQWFRLHAKTVRAEAHKARPNAAVHVAANFMRAIAPDAGATVSVYYPTGSELDTWPLVEALWAQSNIVCLPVVIGKKDALIFRVYDRDTELISGIYGILTPPEAALTVTPDIIVCPLLSFKKNGTRLGMGGGFYDRTLSALRRSGRVLAVGYAYGAQEASQLPADPHDEKLDWIVTEREAIRVTS